MNLESGSAHRPIYEIKANLFKGLAHPLRIRVLEILASAEEVSVAQMLEQTGLEASHLSQHLSVLRRYHLVTSQRRASIVYYRLEFDEVAELLAVARVLLRKVLDTSSSNIPLADEVAAAATTVTPPPGTPATLDGPGTSAALDAPLAPAVRL